MPPVKRDVSRIGGLEIGRHTLSVTARERIRHERIAVSLAPVRRINADQRQVPVWLARVVLSHLAEHRHGVIKLRGRQRVIHDTSKRLLIRLHTRRKPERRTGVIANGMGAVVDERLAAERPDQTSRGNAARYWRECGHVQRATGSAANARTIGATA